MDLDPIRYHILEGVAPREIIQNISMSLHLATSAREAAIAICVAAAILAPQAFSTTTVLSELSGLQAQTGLTLAWINTEHAEVEGVSFKERRLVPLKDSFQAFRPDKFSFGEYPEVSSIGMCWSHDQTKLADTMIDHSRGKVSLGILDLNSKRIRAVAINVDQRPYVTSQCWSPDDKKLVYAMDGAVRLYEIENDRADAIAKGTDPTWSPDGIWIGFRDGDTHYAMHADGSERKKLFYNSWGSAVSALYWSPDSRFVAYVRELGFLQGGALDAEANQLRVRRLEDGSDSALCPDSVDWYANYRWITSSEFMPPKSKDH